MRRAKSLLGWPGRRGLTAAVRLGDGRKLRYCGASADPDTTPHVWRADGLTVVARLDGTVMRLSVVGRGQAPSIADVSTVRDAFFGADATVAINASNLVPAMVSMTDARSTAKA